jgi:hypothetical protein
MDTHLYFDPELIALLRRCTRLVKTVYSTTLAAGLGTVVPSASDQVGLTPLIFLEVTHPKVQAVHAGRNASATSIPPTGPHYRRTTKSVHPGITKWKHNGT